MGAAAIAGPSFSETGSPKTYDEAVKLVWRPLDPSGGVRQLSTADRTLRARYDTAVHGPSRRLSCGRQMSAREGIASVLQPDCPLTAGKRPRRLRAEIVAHDPIRAWARSGLSVQSTGATSPMASRVEEKYSLL